MRLLRLKMESAQSKVLFMRLGIMLLALVLSVAVSAQTKSTIEGTVTSDVGEPLIGVSVIEHGTTNGTMTDFDGHFKLSVSEGVTLEFSYIGFNTKLVKVGTEKRMNITLEENTKVLDEVVVTALGIKRDKKALGYAIQEMKSDALLETGESNVTNALSGKIAGLQIIRSSNGPGGSSKINIRGNSSLTGDNQPLIVVDGIPMSNSAGSNNDDFDNPATDMGNGLSNIAPEDIESMSVLKGGAAAALYGARAGNGVILITTKSGTKRQGLGISVSSSVGFESEFMKPDMQKSFGQGDRGIFDGKSANSWGPAMGSTYTNADGTTGTVNHYDNLGNYFNTGTNFTENIAFNQQYNNTAVYVAFNKLNDNSRIPNSKFKRTSATARALSKFGKDDRWTLDAKVQYSQTTAENRPLSGNNSTNRFLTMYTMPTSVNLKEYKNYLREDGTMNWWSDGNGANPYWLDKRNLNEDTRDRFNMFASLKYQFTDWLNAEVKAGSDMYFTDVDTRTYSGGPISGNGRYSVSQERFYENNYSFLLVANKDNVVDKFGGTVSFGGNIMEQRRKFQKMSPDELLIPNFFAVSNSKGKTTVEQDDVNRKMNSFYGMFQTNYDGWAFLDVTARNDWSSTLNSKNRSFFYPSVSLSWVATDMLKSMSKPLPTWVDFAKVRASWAQVGNDLGPYMLYNTYKIEKDPNDNGMVRPGDILFDETVRSEEVTTYEVGLDARFLGNRIGIDVAWYKTNARRQLLDIPMDPMTGYKSMKVNAGNIQNEGFEFMINGRPLETASGFTWDMMVNISKNKTKIIDLYRDLDRYTIKRFDAIQILAVKGGGYGDIYGTELKRVEDKNSEHYGKLLLTADGNPQITDSKDLRKLGNQQPKALMGITNTFAYKGFTLGFLIDARFGGEIFSYTQSIMQARGTAEITAPGGRRDDLVLDGVYLNAGEYIVNSNAITHQDYWSAVRAGSNVGAGELNTYDATNIRLRNINFSYDFSRKMLAKTPFQQLRVGASVNNVWMIKSHMRGIDPESIFSTGTNATGFENASSPTSRSFLFNVTLGF